MTQKDPLDDIDQQLEAKEAAKKAAEAPARARERLAAEGAKRFEALVDALYTAVCQASTKAQRTSSGIFLGHGGLRHSVACAFIPEGTFREVWKDAVFSGALEVFQDQAAYPGRSSNIWYADVDGDGYGLWETCYKFEGRRSSPPHEPFAVKGDSELRYAVHAATNVIGVELVHKPIKVSADKHFFDRWKARLRSAALGTLTEEAD